MATHNTPTGHLPGCTTFDTLDASDCTCPPSSAPTADWEQELIAQPTTPTTGPLDEGTLRHLLDAIDSCIHTALDTLPEADGSAFESVDVYQAIYAQVYGALTPTDEDGNTTALECSDCGQIFATPAAARDHEEETGKATARSHGGFDTVQVAPWSVQ